MDYAYKRLNHVTINVSNEHGSHEKVRWFYGDVLGLKEVPRAGGLDQVYDLIWFELLDLLIHVDFSPPFVKTAESRHFALEVSNIANYRKYLEGKGADIREAVIIPDRDRFYVVDPFGNYIEILELHSDQKK